MVAKSTSGCCTARFLFHFFFPHFVCCFLFAILKGPLDDDDDLDEHTLATRRAFVDACRAGREQRVSVSAASPKALKRLQLSETGFAKVVPERIFSVAFFPIADRLLVLVRLSEVRKVCVCVVCVCACACVRACACVCLRACVRVCCVFSFCELFFFSAAASAASLSSPKTGDKTGHVGIFDPLTSSEDCTATFRPHIRPVSAIHVNPNNIQEVCMFCVIYFLFGLLAHTHTHRHRRTDAQTHRHTHRHTHTDTHRHTDTQSHRQTDTHAYTHVHAQVFTSSYEGVVRCWRPERAVFTEEVVFADDEHSMLAYSDIDFDKQCVYGCHSDGVLTISDLRSSVRNRSKAITSVRVHDRKVSHVHVNRCDNNYIATSSLDKTVRVWDVRKLPSSSSAKNASKPVSQGSHGMSVSRYKVHCCSHVVVQ